MYKKIYQTLDSLITRHGYICLIFPFQKIFPLLNRVHTLAYIYLIQHLSPTQFTSTGFRLLFGTEGEKLYHSTLHQNHKLILAQPHLTNLFHHNDTTKFIKIISLIFFDKYQRAHPHSDIQRSLIINEYPRIIRTFHHSHHQHFRSRLIQIMASLAHLEQSLNTQTKLIKTCQLLLANHQAQLKSQRQHLINQQLDLLQAQVVSQLSGNSSVYSAPYSRHIPPSSSHMPLLKPDDITAIKSIITKLSQKPSPEIKQLALNTLRYTKLALS